MPTKGWLTSAFIGSASIHSSLARPHEGIDVTAPMGAEIEAPAAGIVTEVRWKRRATATSSRWTMAWTGDALRPLLEKILVVRASA